MTHEEYVFQQRAKAVGTAVSILEGKTGIVDSIRELLALLKKMGIANDPAANTPEINYFVAIESEADEFPLKNVKEGRLCTIRQ